ncbi:MAG TPA: ABC transporter ATP-binding protein [Nitrolancea sp.]|nr:ABC transporter ATP-binding protein [Nitrolancea sp.]
MNSRAFAEIEPISRQQVEETPPDAAVALFVDDVSKCFVRKSLISRKTLQTTHALQNVSLTVGRNEIFGILGGNGSGKSTLIRVMSTLLIPDSGRVKVFGYDIRADESAVKRLINRVSVEASFFKKLSAMENLLYSSRLYGRSGASLRRDIVNILGSMGIEPERINQPLEQLSRGMQQKVAIARAFLTSPVLLLLDEPTTGLDPRSKRDVQDFVRQLRDQHDATILLCSHDMDEAERLCDRIAVLDQGKVVAIDSAQGLKDRVSAELGGVEVTLEDVFIHLTGRALGEDDAEAEVA